MRLKTLFWQLLPLILLGLFEYTGRVGFWHLFCAWLTIMTLGVTLMSSAISRVYVPRAEEPMKLNGSQQFTYVMSVAVAAYLFYNAHFWWGAVLVYLMFITYTVISHAHDVKASKVL